jgi:cell division protein FtsI/penicillin-binding protein 2
VHSEPYRGRILDRNGKVLVDNRLSLAVTVDRQIVDEPEEKRRTVRKLATALRLHPQMRHRRAGKPPVAGRADHASADRAADAAGAVRRVGALWQAGVWSAWSRLLFVAASLVRRLIRKAGDYEAGGNIRMH